MEYLKLFFGIAFLIVFTWILIRNKNRKGILHALLRFDTIVGIIAGIYLLYSSLSTIFSP